MSLFSRFKLPQLQPQSLKRLTPRFPTLQPFFHFSTAKPGASSAHAVTDALVTDDANAEKRYRIGALAIKKGMMSFYDSWGVRHPVTILHMDNVQALDTFQCGAATIQNVGISHRSASQAHSAQLRYYQQCGVAPKLRIRGFKVSDDLIVPKGSFLYAAHFVPGQLVDVQGTSIGKGFQGGMKRWGFHGQPASHGVSLSHRSIGATGGRSTPGRVFKGKKMPGRMGGKGCTVRRLQILKIDSALNCLWVRGAIPGSRNGVIKVTDTRCSENLSLFRRTPPTLPTIQASADLKRLPRNLLAEDVAFDPLFRKTD